MSSLFIEPSRLSGKINIPPSKSHTLRALLFAMMADEGHSIIHSPLASPDTEAMIQALRQLGAKVFSHPDSIEVWPGFRATEDVIDAGNSGQVLRFIGALAGLLPTYTIITGDHSIRTNRPVKPLLAGLQGLGAFVATSREDDCAPIIVRGPILPGTTRLYGGDSQPVSGLLIAASFLKGETIVQVDEPGEKPWIDLTLGWLDRLGIGYENRGYTEYLLRGSASYQGFEMTVPGDFSSAAYPLVAALVTNSELTLRNIDMSDIQGDKKIIEQLIHMGAKIEIGEASLTIHRGSKLQGARIDVNQFIDAITILAVVGCYAEGTTEIFNGAIARRKESDRIHAIATELKKMGADIEEQEDGLIVHHSPLKGAELSSYSDHRIVLSLAVAALGADGKSSIADTGCIAKTYPTFANDFLKIGAKIKETE